MSHSVFNLSKVQILTELQAQAIDKGICPICHEKSLVDLQTPSWEIYQCCLCDKVFIHKERDLTGGKEVVG